MLLQRCSSVIFSAFDWSIFQILSSHWWLFPVKVPLLIKLCLTRSFHRNLSQPQKYINMRKDNLEITTFPHQHLMCFSPPTALDKLMAFPIPKRMRIRLHPLSRVNSQQFQKGENFVLMICFYGYHESVNKNIKIKEN